MAERVDGLTGILYDKLLIQGSPGAVPDSEAAADLLAQKAIEAGIGRFLDESVFGVHGPCRVCRHQVSGDFANASRIVFWAAKLRRVEESGGEVNSFLHWKTRLVRKC